MIWEYEKLSSLNKKIAFPALFVDLNIVDQNIENYTSYAIRYSKTLRLATKSIRNIWLIKYILKRSNVFEGVMCYSVHEAQHLFDNGIDDLLIAYPQIDFDSLAGLLDLAKKGANFSMACDHSEQLSIIDKYWNEFAGDLPPFPLCLDLDVSLRPLPFVHIGALRSSIVDIAGLKACIEKVNSLNNLKIKGILTYEAQIASLQDQSPFTVLLNPIKKLIKSWAIKDVKKKREEITKYLKVSGIQYDYYNGGGSGSLPYTSKEPWISEVTVGSGLLESHIFDYISDNKNRPAIVFGLNITRRPKKGVVTCQSGGFIASGEMGKDKFPLPYRPVGMKYIPMEMAGEVQTPLSGPWADKLSVGDPVFFRPSKAGEIAERFNLYHFLRDGEVESSASTYRGDGKAFY
ncbi:MAG: hypothetical protein HOE90_17320 [Bacteriovoracaceae bacterium]|jgi:D-serine deaminase-like pyridoxal phosphate-dependent protein|nr:hypothetical protein [Bacteriovoracaceae bacterium]